MGLEISDYNRSEEKSEKGIWINHDGAKLKIRHFENEDFRGFIRSRTQANQRLPDGLTGDDDISDEEAAKAIAEHILIDWEGLEVNGEEVEYDVDLAKELLVKTELDRVVLTYAQDYSQFKDDKEELELENL